MRTLGGFVACFGVFAMILNTNLWLKEGCIRSDSVIKCGRRLSPNWLEEGLRPLRPRRIEGVGSKAQDGPWLLY